jgi:neutral ceramidase
MQIGVGRAELEFPDGFGLFGYGPIGGRGYNAPRGAEEYDRLQVRALFLRQGAAQVLVITYDIASGSRLLQAALLRDLRAEGVAIDEGELWVVGTHTHSAPGHYLGNLYDTFGQWPVGFDERCFRELRRKGLAAAKGALDRPKNARVGSAETHVWAGANRNLRPFVSNFEGVLARWEEMLGVSPRTSGMHPEERAIDPRLRVLAFVGPDGERVASWASYCCHPATAPPARWRAYHRDWPGVAADRVESDVQLGVLHMAANGDVTALPPGELVVERPIERIRELGERVGAAWRAAHREAERVATDAELELAFFRFVPEEWQLPRWDIGLQVVAGAPEIDPGAIRRGLLGRLKCGWRGVGQRPKLSVAGPFTPLLSGLLGQKPSPEHPIWLLRVGSHLFYASPFELTTFAAYTLETRLREHWLRTRGERVTASPIGLVGDYAGYVVTPPEYEYQHYEGAHTLYGANQLDALARAWEALITPDRLTLATRKAIDQRRLDARVERLDRS